MDSLDSLIARRIDDGALLDAQYAVARDGEVIATASFGAATPESRFCIFSATKAVFASLVWRLLDDGLLTLGTRVADLWPQFAGHGKDRITVEHLLLHTAGVPTAQVPLARVADRDARVAAMQEWRLEFTPGSRFEYHPFSAGWVLGEVVSRVTGLPHGQALRELVLDPLDIDRLRLQVPAEEVGDVRPMRLVGSADYDAFAVLTRANAVVSTAPDADSDVAAEPPLDPREFTTNRALIAAGAPGAGALSDAVSVARFYQALLHNPGDLWSPEILRDATSNVRVRMPDTLRRGAPANRTLGLIVAGDDNPRLTVPELGIDLVIHPFAPAVSTATFGHGGGGGQIAFADRETGVSFCFLSNVLDQDAFRGFRVQQEIIATALAEATR